MADTNWWFEVVGQGLLTVLPIGYTDKEYLGRQRKMPSPLNNILQIKKGIKGFLEGAMGGPLLPASIVQISLYLKFCCASLSGPCGLTPEAKCKLFLEQFPGLSLRVKVSAASLYLHAKERGSSLMNHCADCCLARSHLDRVILTLAFLEKIYASG